MNGIHRLLAVFLLHQNGDADLGSGDHVDVDAHIVKSLEHLRCHAGVAGHAGSNDGNLGNIQVAGHFVEGQALLVQGYSRGQWMQRWMYWLWSLCGEM